MTNYGFLFDLDGTLIDNMEYHHLTWQRLLKKLGYDWSITEVKAKIWGKNQEIFHRLFGDKYSDSEIKTFCEQKELDYIEIYRSKIEFITGFEDFITAAKTNNIKLAIATAAPPICVNFVKQALNLEKYFEIIIDSEMVAKSKPDPEPYLMAAKKLNLNNHNCLVFEDAPVGVQAAEHASMKSIIIQTTHTAEEFSQFKNVVKIVKNYSELNISECLSFIKD